jgi:hypothetical protein
LDDSFEHDFSEECAGLLSEWYGDDLSSFDPDDEDLNIAFNNLRRSISFWRTGIITASPYQKLRIMYDSLLDAYMLLVEDHKMLLAEKEGSL